MKIALVVAAVLLAVPLAMGFAGLFLPRDHVTSRSVFLKRAPEEVYRIVADFEKAATWRKDLERVEILPPRDGHVVFREIGTHGPLTLEVEEALPPGRLVTRIADDTLPYGGRWVFAIAKEGEGSRVTITEEGFVKNPVFRFLARFAFGHSASIESYLEALTAKLG